MNEYVYCDYYTKAVCKYKHYKTTSIWYTLKQLMRTVYVLHNANDLRPIPF